MQQHCPVVNGQYKIDLKHELKNATFRKLLKPAGVTTIIIAYINALKDTEAKLQREIALLA